VGVLVTFENVRWANACLEETTQSHVYSVLVVKQDPSSLNAQSDIS